MRTILKATGYLVAAAGVIGLATPTAFGAHVGLFHNMVHIGAGVCAVYFSRRADAYAVRSFSVLFGLTYLLIGGAGLLFGVPGAPAGALDFVDPRLLRIIPGYLEFGRVDHVLHALTGAACFIGGMRTRRVHPILGVKTREREPVAH